MEEKKKKKKVSLHVTAKYCPDTPLDKTGTGSILENIFCESSIWEKGKIPEHCPV